MPPNRLQTPIIHIASEDGPKEIVMIPPTADIQQWSRLKLRNKCNRLVLFRMRLEGPDVKQFRIEPTDTVILSPFDSQPFQLAVSNGVDVAATGPRSIVIETAFVQEKTIPTTNKAVLDAIDIWKSVNKDQIAKQVVTIGTDTLCRIRFDKSKKPGATNGAGAVNVVVMDPRDPPWLMNLRIYEVYGFAKSQHPEQTDKLIFYICCFLAACFAVGFWVGMKCGSGGNQTGNRK